MIYMEKIKKHPCARKADFFVTLMGYTVFKITLRNNMSLTEHHNEKY